jgi:ferredoxin/flavodoxin
MKINLYYYSASGNTRLVCEKLKIEIPEIELIDITASRREISVEPEITGFATSTFYLNLPQVVEEFMDSINYVQKKPAFFIITYGMMPGKSIKRVSDKLKGKGFFLIDYHTLRMPESYPVFIAKNRNDENAPNEKEILDLMNFITDLKQKIEQINEGKILIEKEVKPGFWNKIIPAPSSKKIMKQFGKLNVNLNLCNKCKMCLNSCLFNAIEFYDYPVFKMDKCTGCYTCYNKCPHQSIFTDKLNANWQYVNPSDKLKEKFI